MTHGSLFNGIGGFQLAAQWMGWENIFHCEIDEFCNKVVKQHFPNSIQYGDIKTTDFSIHRGRVDVLTGGFPCQPYSVAGKRKGDQDDRHLWPEMLRAVREISPSGIVGENVRGLTNWNGGLVFDEVQADLEAEGYEVLPFLLPACGVGAPHRRDRIWFIAYSDKSNDSRTSRENEGKGKAEGVSQWNKMELSSESNNIWSASNSNSIGQQGGDKGVQEAQEARYDTANSSFRELRPSRFGDSLPTPRIFRSNDGLSNGVDRVKALGNAIVPQVAYQLFKTIELFINEKDINATLG